MSRGDEHRVRPAREALPPCVQGLGKGCGSSGLTNLSQDRSDVGEQVAAASEQVSQFSIADAFGVVAAMSGSAVACGLRIPARSHFRSVAGVTPILWASSPISQSAPFSRGTVTGRLGEYADGCSYGIQRGPVP